MNQKLIFSIQLLTIVLSTQLHAQTPVDVAESTVKVNILGEEIFYFGFAEGDKLIFNFEEANGKEIKEVEIVEMPATSRFIDYKTSRINKTLTVPRTGIYKFRFTNSAGISAKLCKYKIQRIPVGPATQNFNCTVYTGTGNDTTYSTEKEEYLERTDTVLTNYQDRLIKLNTASSPAGNKSTFNFILPDNVIGWSFYLFTNPEGQQAYEEANKKFLVTEKSVIAKFPSYTILTALALNKPISINKPQTGETINYWIMEGENAELFTSGAQFRYIKKGKVISDYSRMDPRKGSLFFCFSNDHPVSMASITAKISTVQVNETLQTRDVKRMQVTTRTKMYLKN
ncbi:MAG: hypothetical protein SGI83_01725 [Bacteroidota bacterium]|nr:hypothetical protein [Bacteroidota bacterium]